MRRLIATALLLVAMAGCDYFSSSDSYSVHGGSSDTGNAASFIAASKYTAVRVGAEHACALGDNEELYCWGANQWGQLGAVSSDFIVTNNGENYSYLPVRVANPLPDDAWIDFDAGGNTTCAVKASGRVFCWGQNTYGAVGVSNSHIPPFGQYQASYANPEEVLVLDDSMGSKAFRSFAAFDMVGVRVGETFACAFSSTTLACWGTDKQAIALTGSAGQGSYSGVPGVMMSAALLNQRSTNSNASLNMDCRVPDAGLCAFTKGDQTTDPWHLRPLFIKTLADGAPSWTDLVVADQSLCLIENSQPPVDGCAGEESATLYGLLTDTNDYEKFSISNFSITGVSPSAVHKGACKIDSSLGFYCASTFPGPLTDIANAHIDASSFGMAFGGANATDVTFGFGGSFAYSIDTIASDRNLACILLNDGTVWCWGANGRGQIGQQPSSPAQIFASPQLLSLPPESSN